MPGGNETSYKEVEKIFTSIAAQVADGPCCSYVGDDGAGHYVKWCTGIEYGEYAAHLRSVFHDERVAPHECRRNGRSVHRME